jgi:hypothetical protein
MREIKFKGKRIDNGEWVCGCLTRYSEYMSYITVDLVENKVYEVYTNTVGEYINYKDLNEEELYESDIIFYHKHEGWYVESVPVYKLGVIAWNDSALGFRIQPIDTRSGKVNYGVDGEKIRTSHRIIKVGNIYESDINELIKKYIKMEVI